MDLGEYTDGRIPFRRRGRSSTGEYYEGFEGFEGLSCVAWGKWGFCVGLPILDTKGGGGG